MAVRVLSLIVTGLLTGGVVGGQEPVPVPTSQPVPHLEVTPTEMRFGELWQGDPAKGEFTIKNTGQAPLTVDVKTSCGCTTPTRPKSPLAPGESDTLTITYDTAHRPGAAHQTVTVTTNDPVRPDVIIPVVGSVKPLYELVITGTEKKSNTLSFGKLYTDSADVRGLTILNRYNEKVTFKLKEGVDGGAYAIELKEVEPGMRYELTARTKPPLAVGDARGRVVIETGVARLPEFEILIFGAVQPPIALEPSRLLAPKNAPTEVRQVVRALSASRHPVKVLSAKASHEAIQVTLGAPPTPTTNPSDQVVQEIVITLPPGEKLPADVPLTVEVTTDSAEPNYQKLTLPIRVIAPTPATPPVKP